MPRKMQQVETKDTGTPGMLYFNEPKLIEIPSKTKGNPQNPLRPHEVASTSHTYGEGACRLLSSHRITGYKPPNNCEYHLGRWPNKMDVDAYMEIVRTQGYGEGTIVCRKYQPLADAFKIYRWGVIMLTHKYISASEFKPFLVKWFSDGQSESSWAEDLFVIHSCVDKSLIGDILESQGCDFGGEAT